MVVRQMNRLKRKEEAEAPAPPTTRDCPYCLSSVPLGATRCSRCTSELAPLARIIQCAVERRRFSVGAKPTRQLSLQPVAIGAAVEVTKPLKPSV